jgi:transcription elongation factor SPT6
MDELKDVYNHFLLYYGRDIPKMQNAAKASRKKLKRIKEDGDEEGACGEGMLCHWLACTSLELSQILGSTSETRADWSQILFPGEGEEAEDEEQRGPELKQASRRDMYTICQSAGLGTNHLLCHLGIVALNKETAAIIP